MIGFQHAWLHEAGNVHISILRQTRAYKKTDPKKKHQKALSIQVYDEVYRDDITPFNQSVATLLIIVLFFAIWLCEYTTTTAQEEKQAWIIKVKNIKFYKHKKNCHTTAHTYKQHI